MNNYIEERCHILENLNTKYLNLTNKIRDKNLTDFDINSFNLLNKEIDNIIIEVDDLDLNLDLKYTKQKNKDFLNRLEDMNNSNNIINSLKPYLLLLQLNNLNNTNCITCNECNKNFVGKDYLRRYRQHYNAKHR